jgi:hypothetical protein
MLASYWRLHKGFYSLREIAFAARAAAAWWLGPIPISGNDPIKERRAGEAKLVSRAWRAVAVHFTG